MKSNMLRICAMLAGGLTGSVPLRAQQHTMEGVWNVSVTVTVAIRAVIRTVHSLQLTGWKIRSSD